MTPAARALLTLALATSPALADWPADPATPLVVGQAEGAFGPRLSAIASDDGAVWIAWQDSFCGGFDGGAVRLQRIAPDASLLTPDGLEVQPDETCGFILPPVLVPVADGAMVSRAFAGLNAETIQTLDASGAIAWPDGFSTTEPRYLGAAARMPGGDTLIVTVLGSSFHAHRLDAAGDPVWATPAQFESDTGSNLRVFAIVPNPDGGAYVFWDSSAFAYTRLIRAQRIDADGKIAWPASVRLVSSPNDITSSRHSDPVAVPDGQGGAVVVFAQGFETGFEPAPLRMQGIAPDGSLAFPITAPVRVSLGDNRQFDPIVHADPASGDLLVVWRDGVLADQGVHAQRVTPAGDRLWTDHGVAVASLTQPDAFDALWQGDRLSIVTASADGVTLHTLDAMGQPALAPVPVGVGAAAIGVSAAPSADGIVASWQHDLPGNDDLVVAQRVNRDGRLGDPACSPADLDAPYGSIDFSDVVAFLVAFSASNPAADLAEPIGQWDFSDVVAFLTSFASGCP